MRLFFAVKLRDCSKSVTHMSLKLYRENAGQQLFTQKDNNQYRLSTTCLGEKKRRVYCVREDTREEVSKSNCDHSKKPSHKQRCNNQPCPARLVTKLLNWGGEEMIRFKQCPPINGLRVIWRSLLFIFG